MFFHGELDPAFPLSAVESINTLQKGSTFLRSKQKSMLHEEVQYEGQQGGIGLRRENILIEARFTWFY